MPWQIGPIRGGGDALGLCPRLLWHRDPGWELRPRHTEFTWPFAGEHLHRVGRCHRSQRVVDRDHFLTRRDDDLRVAHVDALGILRPQYADDLIASISRHIERGIRTVGSHHAPSDQLEFHVVADGHDSGEGHRP